MNNEVLALELAGLLVYMRWRCSYLDLDKKRDRQRSIVKYDNIHLCPVWSKTKRGEP